MKRAELLHKLAKGGCLLLRHGRRHDWYQNPVTGVCQPIPRHNEIKERLARHIQRKLGQ